MRFNVRLLSLFFCVLSLLLAWFFRCVPSVRVWEGFRVFFVPSSFDSASVVEILEGAGFRDVVFREGQKTDFFDAYFSDRGGSFSLYYVRDGSGDADSAAERLLEAGAEGAGFDGGWTYDARFPALCLGFLALLLSASKSRVSLLLCAAFPLAAVFAVPSPRLASCVSLSLLGFFLLLFSEFPSIFGVSPGNLRRAFFAEFSFRSRILSVLSLLLIFAPVLVLLAFDLRGFVVLLASAAASLLSLSFRLEGISFPRFAPLASAALCAASFALGFFLSGLPSGGFDPSSGASSAVPDVPSPVSGGGTLPTLSDFAVSEWNRLSEPYRPVSDSFSGGPPGEGETISITEYTEVGGRIVPEERVLFVYGQDFVSDAVSALASDPGSFASVLFSQSGESFGYLSDPR